MITRSFEKQTKKRLSLKTKFKIEFLLPFIGSKVLEKVPVMVITLELWEKSAFLKILAQTF